MFRNWEWKTIWMILKKEWNKENNPFKKDHLLVIPVLLSLSDWASDPTNTPTNPQNRGGTGTLVCPAPRCCAVLSPQPAVLMTDVRTYLNICQNISEYGNQQGNQNYVILSCHFIPQILKLGLYSSTQEHVLSATCNGWHSPLSPAALKVLSTEYKNSQNL